MKSIWLEMMVNLSHVLIIETKMKYLSLKKNC